MTKRGNMPWRPGMTTPGKITREDYRLFSWSAYLNYESTRKQIAGMEKLSERLKSYLEHRQGYEMQVEDNRYFLRFSRLDDARMFVLSFSDVIETNGVRFD